MNKEKLKEVVKTIVSEEQEYKEFFKKALEKAGKSIPSMSDEEKKAFFNKIDAAWNARGEKNEELTGNQHKLDVDGDGEIEASDLAKLRAKKDESVNEARTVSKPIKVDDDTMVQIVGDNKGFRELTAALNPKTGKPIQKFGYERGNEIADSKEELIKKLQKKYGKSIKFESVNEDLDVGHQDDEPNMLKSTVLELVEYGTKLLEKLEKYDAVPEEVDFPNWWQAKVILSKEYIQKAYHFLDSEEKTGK